MPRELKPAFRDGTSPKNNIFLALLSGLFVGLLFPPFNLSYLAWFSLVPILLLSHPRIKKRFLFGWLAGTASSLLIYFWIWKTFLTAGLGFFTTLACWLALSGLLGLYWGLFLAGNGSTLPPLARPFFLAGVWVILEWVRGWILTGFPWAFLSHSQAFYPALIQTASIGGAWTVSFLIVFFNASLAEILKSNGSLASDVINKFRVGLTCFLLIAVAWGWGWTRARTPSSSPVLTVSLLQGNIDQYEKWNDQYEEKIRNVYEGLVEESGRVNPDLIVWPESAIPAWFPNQEAYRIWVEDLVQKSSTAHLVGAVTSQKGKEFNSAFLIGPEGKILGRYDKRHLVPFGEYIPFGKIFARWVPYLGQLGSFDPGESVPLLIVKGVRMSVTICYEAMFPRQNRLAVKKGADVIVNLTNDGWYLDTGAPGQHFVGNIFRAVENGVSVVRAANSGISGVIDPRGKIVLRTPLLQRGTYAASVPSALPATFYQRFGDWFPLFCLGFVFFLLGFYRFKSYS